MQGNFLLIPCTCAFWACTIFEVLIHVGLPTDVCNLQLNKVAFTYLLQRDYPNTTIIIVKPHSYKVNCLAEQKATADNRRKTIAKPVETIAAKTPNFEPQTLYNCNIDNHRKCFTGKSKLFRRKSHHWQSPQNYCKTCKDNRSKSPNFAKGKV